MTNIISGTRFPVLTTAEADRGFREHERQFTSREQTLELLEKNSVAYLAWLDQCTPEHLDRIVELPFGMGSIPAAHMLPFMAGHINNHTAQIEYIQTIYADQDWHH
jgi:hypothetical protein